MEELSGKTALVTWSTDGSAASSLANSGKPTRACWSMIAMPREALAVAHGSMAMDAAASAPNTPSLFSLIGVHPPPSQLDGMPLSINGGCRQEDGSR
jgi:hypothetical protein